MLKKSSASTAETPLSFDPDKADKSGFLHNVRAVVEKVRAILYSYPNKQGEPSRNEDGSQVQAPGLMVTFKAKDRSYEQFYANGSADDRVPTKDGHGFRLAKGSKVQSALAEGSNAYTLIASFKGAGWPSDGFSGDCTVFEGTEVDLIAQPVGQNSSRAKAEGAKVRTIAVVGRIVSMPGGSAATGDEDEDEDQDDEEETPAKSKKKAAPVDEDDEDEDEDEGDEADETDDAEDESDPLVIEAQEFVAAVLELKQYRGKEIPLETLAGEVLKLAKLHKQRKKIVELVQDPAFHSGDLPWTYSKKTKSISLNEE